MKVYLNERFACHGWDVYLYRDLGDDKKILLLPDGQEKVIDSCSILPNDITPTFFIDYPTAQELIAALQSKGVRPVEISKVEGKLESQTAHLADLQNILRARGIMK